MTLFQPGRNVWTTGRASRAAVLIDAAAYFGALREALKKARHTVFVIGWDINSKVPLVGESGRADDGYPEPFCDFLCALTQARPELQINLLLWDFSVLYSTEREMFPALTLGWKSPPGVQLCLDDALPLGSAHHQKLVVIDDRVAFSGGLDITDKRWDTPGHSMDNPVRKDLSGKPYRPFHDVQMVVDGTAAQRLGELARTRWHRATFEKVPEVEKANDCWPDRVKPDFTDAEIGIALTQPRYDTVRERADVEQLFLDSIDLAERHIYIENQFLTRINIAERIAQRMRAKPDLETLIVTPYTHESWIEARTMKTGRIKFRHVFTKAGVADRMRMVFPEVAQDGKTTDTMVHSKVMMVDDVFLRVGSANLNNRSMGTDTECDLAVHAVDAGTRAVVTRIRNTLIGEHCCCDPAAVSARIAETGSLLRTVETLSERGHRLRPVDDGVPDPKEIAITIGAVADPERTVGIEELLREIIGAPVPYRNLSHGIQVAVGALIALGLVIAWRFTPLAEYTDPHVLRAAAMSMSESMWAPLIVIMVFIAGGFVLFPVTILIAVTAGTFGPWPGLVYAGLGALASSLTTYGLGARLGKETLRNLIGPRLNRVTRRVTEKGILTVAAIRLVPVAPFTIVNLVAGASGIRFSDFVIGTALGLLPGLIVLSSLGTQIFRVLANPDPIDILLFLALVALWIGLSFALQILVARMRTARA